MIYLGSYKMLIADELKELKQILLEKSSLKERAFYFYLIEEPLNYPTQKDLSEIEQVCLSVFCTDAPDKQEIIEAHRRKQPISGMHYTETVIDLSAMANGNFELERENLKSHCEDHSTRNFYVLNHLYPNISSNPPLPQGAIDEIALYLYDNDFPREGWKRLLLGALQETADLVDFYITEKGYLKAMDNNPIIHQTNDIICVSTACRHFVEKIERRVKRIIGIVSSILVLGIVGEVVRFILVDWDKAEPIITATELCFRVVLFLSVVFFRFNRGKEIFISFRDKILDWVFSRRGLNRSELKEKLDKLGPSHLTE